MVERLTWKKLAKELVFLHPLGNCRMDLWLHAMAFIGCNRIAAHMASAQSNASFSLAMG